MAQPIADMLKDLESKFEELKYSLIQRLTNHASNATPNHADIY